MSIDARTPSLAQVISTGLDRRLARTRVCDIARVESYDSAKQTVNVQPLIKDRVTGEDDEVTAERLPVITNVPVVFPGSGEWAFTFPISPGDTVLLVFADRSIDVWLSEGGEVDPGDDRRHHLSDAIAIPGVRSLKAPLSGVDTTHAVIGKPGAATDAVALAQKVDDAVSNIKTWLTTHTHPVSGTVAGVSVLAAPVTSPAGSSTVKVST